MTAEPAEQILHGLGRATSRFVEQALGQLSAEARGHVAELLAGGEARLVVLIDVAPYAVRLILHRAGERPVTICSLTTAPEQTH